VFEDDAEEATTPTRGEAGELMGTTQCDIIIPVLNRAGLTRNCLRSIEGLTHTPHRIILIDNGSDRETREFLENYKISSPDAVLVRNETNAGWVKAVNQGMRLSSSPYVCVMNNDTAVKTDDWLARLMEIAKSEPDIGLVNPRFDLKRRAFSERPFVEVDFCRGYCVLIKRKVIETIGMLDEAYGLGYYDDDDYSVRAIRAGFRCVRARDVSVLHVGDSTFTDLFRDGKRRALHEANKRLFYSKWGRRLRLVLIITQEREREAIARTAFMLARSQHIVYLWNAASPMTLAHINIRETAFPQFFSRALFAISLSLNRKKSPSKRYDAVLTDNWGLSVGLSKIVPRAYYFNFENDVARIFETIDALARV
jgi:GT2 family glycosyltransferase